MDYNQELYLAIIYFSSCTFHFIFKIAEKKSVLYCFINSTCSTVTSSFCSSTSSMLHCLDHCYFDHRSLRSHSLPRCSLHFQSWRPLRFHWPRLLLFFDGWLSGFEDDATNFVGRKNACKDVVDVGFLSLHFPCPRLRSPFPCPPAVGFQVSSGREFIQLLVPLQQLFQLFLTFRTFTSFSASCAKTFFMELVSVFILCLQFLCGL